MNRNRISTSALGALALAVTVSLNIGVMQGAETTGRVKGEKQVLAVVNGDSIFTTDIDAFMGRMHSSMTPAALETFDYHKLLNKLVNDRLIIQEAKAVGMEEDPALVARLTNVQRSAAIKAYVKDNYKATDSVSDAEILSYFRANYLRKQVRTVSVESLAVAKRLLEQVRRGADMDSIAKAMSVDIYRYQGGLHRAKYIADIEVEVRQQLTSLKDGQLAGPFPYRQVYAMVRLEKTTPADTSELAQNRSYIKSIIQFEKRADSWERYTNNLRKKHGVVIDSSALAKIIFSGKAALDSSFMRGTDKPVATIDDTVRITDDQVRQAAAHQAMADVGQPIDSLTRTAFNDLINNVVLFDEAHRGRYDQRPEVLRRVAEARDSSLIEAYLGETVVARIKFNHQEFNEYYQQHQEDFRRPPDLNLKQLLVDRQGQADSIIALLKDGADFDFVAHKFVQDPTKFIDNNEWISAASMPQQVQDDLAKLAVGQTSKGYATADGWLIFKIKDRRKGKVKTMDEVEMQIREVIFQKKFNELLDQTLNTLKQHSKIVYFDQAIDKYLGSARP